MALIDTPKRIVADEYEEKDRNIVSRLAQPLNFFMEQVTNVINGRLDFDNLNRSTTQITVNVDTNGTPIRQTQFNSNIGLQGLTVLRAQNTSNPVNFPTGAPFISFSSDGTGTYTIQNITGLRPGNNYLLTLELIF